MFRKKVRIFVSTSNNISTSQGKNVHKKKHLSTKEDVFFGGAGKIIVS